MSNLTYEYTDLRSRLETFEWDNAWIEHSEDNLAVLRKAMELPCFQMRELLKLLEVRHAV